MPRHSSSDTLVLSVSPKGESNRTATLFTAELGIHYATLYGGPKSKMRALVSPYCRGIMYLYTDEVRHSAKIIDFDVKNFHPTFRESIFKSWAAALAVELLVRTSCAGSPAESWPLINGFLDGLDLCDDDAGRTGLIRFLWRYTGLLGIRPDAGRCCRCGTSFFDKKALSYTTIENAVYSPADNGFICAGCTGATDPAMLSLHTDSVRYLGALSVLAPRQVRSIPVSLRMAQELKQLTFFLIENSAGVRLKSLESGIGIL